MAQVIVGLASKCEALSSNPSTAKNKNQTKPKLVFSATDLVINCPIPWGIFVVIFCYLILNFSYTQCLVQLNCCLRMESMSKKGVLKIDIY
jgi:hypothetical protein